MALIDPKFDPWADALLARVTHRPGNRRAKEAPPKFTCPHCGEQTSRVVNTRGLIDTEAVRRRRKCVHCGARWSTVERFIVGSVARPPKK